MARRLKPKAQRPSKPLCEGRVIYPTKLDAQIEVAGHVRYNNDVDSQYSRCRRGNHYHVFLPDREVQ